MYKDSITDLKVRGSTGLINCKPCINLSLDIECISLVYKGGRASLKD